MAHHHHHGTREGSSEKNLFITMLLNFFITIVEIAGGILSGSLSLLSDAIHNFSDGIAIIVSYVAIRLSKKPRTLKYTFGLKRAELLAAIINASTLIIISFFLIKEAIERFSTPTPITGFLMLTVAVIGLVANVVGTLLLKKDSASNINIRATYVHLLSDAVSSLAVIIGAFFIIIFNVTWVDPLLTILISIYILKETYDIIKEAVDVIMMSTPAEIDMNELQRMIEAIPGVRNIHHVHLWRMNDSDIHFEAHIDVDDVPVSDTTDIRNRIETSLRDKHEITHTTLQFECDSCSTKNLV
jgi:cobalt-zinc-cadmium efflux system protein